MRLSSALAGALSLATLALASSDVVDLTAKSFDKEVTNDSGLTLVEFFAPWCGHCKALAPHYEEAATALKEKNIKIAKVDCTVEAELCQEHGISGYPTLKVFNAGAVSDYTGPRKADGIISYMTKQSLPAVTEITDAEHESFKTADKIVVVSYTTSGKAPEAFTKFASSARDSYLFGHTASKSVLSAESITADQIVLYKSFDEPFLSLPGDLYKGLTAEKLGLWVKENAVPTLGEISPENFGTYAQAGKPIAYVFVDPNESNEALLKSLEPLAKTHKSELSWVFIDGIKFVDHAKSLNVDVASWPRFVVQDLTLQAKYPLKTAVNAANVKSFVEEYLAGDVAPDVKSAKVKEVQDESVWDLATDEYEQVVWEDGKDKDVFVEFFAPWCGHCKKLKPIWDTLGDKYADVDSVLIAKFDATENDVPPFEPFKIQGFPTLKFRPAGSDEWVDYSGDRSLESLVEFLEENAASDLTVKNVTKRATEAAAAADVVIEKGAEAKDTIVDKAGEAYDAAVEKGEEVVEAVKSTGEQVVRKVREEL